MARDGRETSAGGTAEDRRKQTAGDILEGAAGVLDRVDEARVFRDNAKRDFPAFCRSELVLSENRLGIGGFGIVFEVRGFRTVAADAVGPVSAGTAHALSHAAPDSDSHNETEEDRHYDVDSAKAVMEQRCLRLGKARYAVKRLRSDLDELDRARGMLDLAIEISFLRVLWHPNIVKMRGVSDTPRISADTFLILDRLFGTLEDKYEEWHQTYKKHKGGPALLGHRGRNDKVLEELLKDRLLVAYDLTQAFRYLHQHNLLYRDIKPENFGFDVRGDVKVFDFGLARSLDKKDRSKGYGYHLTRLTGSVPYMAPEVAKGEPYSYEADVFSFSILLWEIMSINWAFNGYHLKEYYVNVVRKGERPVVKKDWPAIVRTIMVEAWNKDPQRRPTMKRFGSLIHGVLEDMTSDDSVINRTQYMLRRSRTSMHVGERGLVALQQVAGASSRVDLP